MLTQLQSRLSQIAYYGVSAVTGCKPNKLVPSDLERRVSESLLVLCVKGFRPISGP